MFSSNQTKQRKYIKLRRAEEENAVEQQARLDEQIAKERGFETRVSNLSKLAKRVAGETFTVDKFKYGADASYEDFSKTVKRITGLDPLSLSKAARLVWKDLNSPEFIQSLNEWMLDEADRLKSSGLTDDQSNRKLYEEVQKAVYSSDKIKNEIMDALAKLEANTKVIGDYTKLGQSKLLAAQRRQAAVEQRAADKFNREQEEKFTTAEALARAAQVNTKKKPGRPSGPGKQKRINLD